MATPYFLLLRPPLGLSLTPLSYTHISPSKNTTPSLQKLSGIWPSPPPRLLLHLCLRDRHFRPGFVWPPPNGAPASTLSPLPMFSSPYPSQHRPSETWVKSLSLFTIPLVAPLSLKENLNTFPFPEGPSWTVYVPPYLSPLAFRALTSATLASLLFSEQPSTIAPQALCTCYYCYPEWITLAHLSIHRTHFCSSLKRLSLITPCKIAPHIPFCLPATF